MPTKVSPNTVKEAIRRVASTDDGQLLLHTLMMECEYHKNFLSATDPMIAHCASIRRGVYAKMRQYIRNEHLKVIEYDIDKLHLTNKRKANRCKTSSTNSTNS